MKYKLTEKTQRCLGKDLYRIQALKDFGDVKAGDLGGWVESEANLSQGGDCWVYNEAKVYDDAQVLGNARIMGKTQVYGRVEISGNALIKSSKDYCSFQSFGSRNGITTFYRDKDGDIFVNCGCFYGGLKEFKSNVKDYHGNHKFGREYLAIIKVVKIKFEEPNNKLHSAFNHIKRKVAFFNKMFKFKK